MIYSFELNDEETKYVEDYMRDVGETSLSDMVKRILLEDVAESRAGAEMWRELIEAEEAEKRKEIEA